MALARRLRTIVAAAVAVSGVVLIAVLSLPFAVDDAFIVLRYADNLAHGGGWAMNAGTPTDGVTGPLWILPSFAASLAGLDPLAASRAIGVALGGLAAALVVFRVGRRAGGARGALVAALLLAISPQLAIWCVAGLETGAATLFATTAALAATARPAPRPVLLGASIAALAALRPELAFFVLVLLGGVALRDRRSAAIAFGIAGAAAITIVVARLVAFGDPLPLSFHAKPSDVSLGASYTVRGALVVTGLGGLVLALTGALRGRRDDRVLFVALLAHGAAVALAGGDWMPGFRLLVPVIPTYALLAGVACTRPLPRPRRRGLSVLVLILGAAALVIPALDAFVQVPRAREAGHIRVSDGRALAAYLERAGDSVALVDIGYLGYRSGLEVVDLGGVTDPFVARAPGDHTDKVIDIGYLAQKDPDLVVLTSAAAPRVTDDGRVRLSGAMAVEYRLAATEWLAASHRVVRVMPYGERFYVVLARR